MKAIQERDIDMSFSDTSENASLYNLLVNLLTAVKLQGYKFTTITPRTHERFLEKHKVTGKNLRDIFGWSLPFSDGVLCPMLKKLMVDANLLEKKDNLWRSKLRISSLGPDLFLHSCFPTAQVNDVFFGPDTYRFARFVRHSLAKYSYFNNVGREKPLRILDIGCGTGAGGITAVRALSTSDPYELTLNDLNQAALRLASVNADVAGVKAKFLPGSIFDVLHDEYDLIISNPPYMQDDSSRAYRDGGGQLGLDLSIRIFKSAFEHLSPGGQLLLYTGVAMTNQSDPFLNVIKPLLSATESTWSYEEIDPDVFGEDLALPQYQQVHRIAAVGLIVRK